ncbi:MAG TPA: FGGY family carbohydrate kinase, partial [Usitatibacter sp.]|nr:FGGY family carbohydrate kinase [Usitatibacter sp.]
WAEQDGDEIVASVLDAATQAVAALGADRVRLAAAGLASQRASCVCWDRRDGRPLSPVFSWQDRRAHAWIGSMEAAHGDAVHRATGLFLSPHYGASKLRWALDHLPAVRAAHEDGSLAWGPMASFLAFRLLRERPMLADPQCAARTQLWNLGTRDWDPSLLALFGLPAGHLPQSTHTVGHWGTFETQPRGRTPGTHPGDAPPRPGVAIPMRAVNGDQSAAVFAFGWPEADSAYVNIGTSAFVQRVTEAGGHVPRQLTGIILDDGTRTLYTVEGNVNGAGAGLEWFAREFDVPSMERALPEWLSRPVDGVPLFLNGIAGLGGPFWQAEFDSRFVGEGDTAAKAVALVESIAFLLQANADHMAKYVAPMKRIRVSGGLSRIDGLCRALAALAGVPVLRRDDPEASARGIAYLAAGYPGDWNSGAAEDVFAPVADAALAARYQRWRALMAQATGV